MGLYDREYARYKPAARPAGIADALSRFSAVQVLMGINVVIWVLWMVEGLQPFLSAHFKASATGVFKDCRIHTLLTAAFSHRDLPHIFLNMFALHCFGKMLEESLYGVRNLIFLYVSAAIFSSFAYVGVHMLVAAHSDSSVLGASGAISAISVVCALLYPNRQVLLMGVAPIQLKWLAVVYVALDVLGSLNQESSHIAHTAHLGGALTGFIFYKLDLRLFSIDSAHQRGYFARLFRRLSRPRLRLVERPRVPDTYDELANKIESTLKPVDSDVSERVDELLRKISEHGLGALTHAEHEFLRASSEKYRK